METVKTQIGNKDKKTDWLKINAKDALTIYEDMCKVLDWAEITPEGGVITLTHGRRVVNE